MLGFLFPRLTPAPQPGEALFAAVTEKVRQKHWYVEGQVPDTLDGRFRMLATLSALTIVRLEQLGVAGEAASVSLIERFIEVMESEHRELGLGDPALGRTVQKLVGSLAGRVEIWRNGVETTQAFDAAANDSIYHRAGPTDALAHSASALGEFWNGLRGLEVEAIMEGRLG